MGPSFVFCTRTTKTLVRPCLPRAAPRVLPSCKLYLLQRKIEERGKNNRNKNIRNFKIKLLPQFDGSEQNLNRRFITTRSNIFKKKFV